MAEKNNPISNMSYTNRDFQTIFPELLDVTNELTDKWDPASSNESDPGVVLLKEDAIITDKNNYNIDKNALENYPLSVTQHKNAVQVFESKGYRPQLYVAAEGNLSLYWQGAEESEEESEDEIATESVQLTSK